MRKLAHISDLHFGKEDPEIVKVLKEDLLKNRPDLVIISGDFTQRGRVKQYKKARAFLDSLPLKTLSVPGNHDIPLFDIFRRFFAPLTRYRKYISEEVNPLYADEEIVVCGLNTARSLTWKEGRISVSQIAAMENKLCPFPNERLKIVVTHHPFLPPPDNKAIKLVGRSRLALDIIDKCNADLLLAGHLHTDYSGDIRGYYVKRKRSVIAVQASTAVSTRTRTDENAYNLITVNRSRIDIQVRFWNGSAFLDELLTSYEKKNDEWVHLQKIIMK